MGGADLGRLLEAFLRFAQQIVRAVEVPEVDEVLGVPGVDLGRLQQALLGALLPAVIGVAQQGQAQQRVVAGIGIVGLEGLLAVLDGVVEVLGPEELPGLDEKDLRAAGLLLQQLLRLGLDRKSVV